MNKNSINNELTFYVSPNGNDKWSGKMPEPDETGSNGPFATITKVRDTLRNKYN